MYNCTGAIPIAMIANLIASATGDDRIRQGHLGRVTLPSIKFSLCRT